MLHFSGLPPYGGSRIDRCTLSVDNAVIRGSRDRLASIQDGTIDDLRFQPTTVISGDIFDGIDESFEFVLRNLELDDEDSGSVSTAHIKANHLCRYCHKESESTEAATASPR